MARLLEMHALLELLPMPFSFPIRAVIGEVDEEMDAEMNLADIRAEPLNPVLH